MANQAIDAGLTAIETKGWLAAHKWLLLRRFSQISAIGLFLLGPWFGLWLIKGNLTASLLLDTVPLTDPYVLLQSLFTGMIPASTAFIGAGIVLVFYWAVGGRVYCSWLCPVNIVTDAAAWLRRRLSIKGKGLNISRSARYWLLGLTLILATVSGSLVWELVNPVSMLHRGLIFGMGLGWYVILAVFLFEFILSKHGWCGYLCPVGAFYSLPALISPLRISASKREACDDCMDCFAVCPEPQVIKPALKGAAQGISPLILAPNCTNCGRCIDVCAKDVFGFQWRTFKTNKQ